MPARSTLHLVGWEADFADDSIEVLAWPGAFRRGLQYFSDNRVQILAASDSVIEQPSTAPTYIA